jgi:hypothetical protein
VPIAEIDGYKQVLQQANETAETNLRARWTDLKNAEIADDADDADQGRTA